MIWFPQKILSLRIQAVHFRKTWDSLYESFVIYGLVHLWSQTIEFQLAVLNMPYDPYLQMPILARRNVESAGHKKCPSITATSPERHGVLNHWQIYCLVNSSFSLKLKITSEPALLAICEGKTTGGRWIPSQRASNTEIVLMPWRRHAFLLCCAFLWFYTGRIYPCFPKLLTIALVVLEPPQNIRK